MDAARNVPSFDSQTMSKIHEFNHFMGHQESARLFTKSKMKEMAKTLQNANNQTNAYLLREVHFSSTTLKDRVLTLEAITKKSFLPPRQFFFHSLTLGLSYLFVKMHDHSKAKKILNTKQQLTEKYLAALLAPTNTDPEKTAHIQQVIRQGSTKTRREILKYALKEHDQALIKQCRALLKGDSFKQKEWKAAIKQLKTSQDLSKVNRLIEEGVDINANVKGCTALAWAARYVDYTDLVRVLVNAGADMNKPSFWSDTTPLVYAIRHGVTENAKTLIHAGADCTRGAPLMCAVKHNRPDILADLLPRIAANAENRNVALRKAIRGGCERIALQLIPSANVNELVNGQTPLRNAIARGQVAVVTALLERGANPNTIIYSGTYDRLVSYNELANYKISNATTKNAILTLLRQKQDQIREAQAQANQRNNAAPAAVPPPVQPPVAPMPPPSVLPSAPPLPVAKPEYPPAQPPFNAAPSAYDAPPPPYE